MRNNKTVISRSVLCTMLLAGVLTGSDFVSSALAQPEQSRGAHFAARTAARPAPGQVSPFHQASLTDSAKDYYQAVWGVDTLLVRRTASGNLIRFSYRVTNPVLAKVLGDDRATPYLYGQRSRALLQIPVMDKIGRLRQTGTPQEGKEYWMVFSNKGDMVKRGDRVNVIIGSFHADGVMVE